ncbi:peptide-binding protein [Salipaludibacillus sp. CUR1]|uniref:peptide-binding protein n=1 Tax=Salipaludibacillus sp. CUR1 TaxID=2820003 RepID=UPI001E5D4420|nr:peptide-binding protein [Salipaludibacillus sp. CUR1]
MKKKVLGLSTVVLATSIFAVACGGDDNLEEAMQEERNDAEENNNNADAGEEADNDTNENEGNEEASGEAQDGGDLTIGIVSDPVQFLPTHSSDTASGDIEDIVFNQLVRIDEEIEIQPELAVDWEESEDGLTYTFEIHEGVTFHDGEPLTADDVAFTFNIFIDEDYTGPRGGYFRALEEVEALDETTVEFRLSEPDARFLGNLGFGIMPEHILGDVPATELEEHDFTRDPVGSGPFEFDTWEDGQYVQLTAYEDYWEGAPHLDRLTLSIVGDQNAMMAQIEGGDIEMGVVPATDFSTAERWDEEGLVTLSSTLGYQYNYMGYNTRLDMFSDKETRQALTHAIDRQTIIDQVGQGQGEVAHGPVSPLSWAYPDSMPEFEYDPDLARELLEEAGWEEGGDGILERDGERFSFTLKTNSGNQIREDIAVIIQSMLNEVGVEVDVEYVEWGAFLDQIYPPNWDFDAIILGWALGTDPDPRAIWHTEEIEQGQNYTGFSRDDVDELIDENVLIVDQDERAEALHEIFEIIAEEQPYTFLYYPNDLVAIPTNLEGFIHHPRLSYYKPHEWYFTAE